MNHRLTTHIRLWQFKGLAGVNYNETWDPYHTCTGHNPDDLQPFHDLFPDWDEKHEDESSSIKRYYSNAELYRLLQPDSEDLPYVYDNFDWHHCSVSFRLTGRWTGPLCRFGRSSLVSICEGLWQQVKRFRSDTCHISPLGPRDTWMRNL